MKELIKITEDGVDARELHKFLGVGYLFRNWIRVSIRDYGFIEGEDFRPFMRESTGGRPAKEYALSIGMAKELSMVSKTKRGKEARKYFIKCEAIAKKAYAEQLKARISGKEARRELTDALEESGENERMHGHGYSTYTNMIYKIIGIEKGQRDSLPAETLDMIKSLESLAKTLVDMGKEYSEIKETLKPIFNPQLSLSS